MRRQGRAPRTIHARTDVLLKLADWLEADPAHASRDDLEQWQDMLLATSQSWLRWCTTIARPYYRFVHVSGYRDDDPSALLVVPPARPLVPHPMAEADVMHAIANAPPRILPWLLLAGWCGLRAAEIARLRGEDFAVGADGHVWIDVHGKGGRQRRVPVPLWMWPALAPHIPTTGPCWELLHRPEPVTARHVSQYSALYLHGQGIEESLHSLRHRLATLTLQATGISARSKSCWATRTWPRCRCTPTSPRRMWPTRSTGSRSLAGRGVRCIRCRDVPRMAGDLRR